MAMEDNAGNNASDIGKFLGRVTNSADAFWWKIDALLEVMEVSLPEVVKLDSDEQITSMLSKAFLHLESSEVKKLRDILKKIQVAGKEGEDNRPFMALMWDEVKSEPWGPRMMSHLHEASRRPPRVPLFLQSTTVAAVSNSKYSLLRWPRSTIGSFRRRLSRSLKIERRNFPLRNLRPWGLWMMPSRWPLGVA